MSLAARLARGPVFLGWSEIASPAVVALMARAGHDALLFDQQHGGHDSATCRACIGEAALAGVPALVRVKVGDFAEAARMLDAGAAGIVAPMIDTAEEAARFVREVKYPPLGARSWGPGRAVQIAGLSAPDYFATANAETLAIAMVETRAAFDGLEALLAVPGLDGILVGPADLSLALTGRIDPMGAEMRRVMAEVGARARAAGRLACAFAGTPARARELVAEGYGLVSVAYDSLVVAEGFAAALSAARDAP